VGAEDQRHRRGHGPAGTGKTITAKAIRAETPGSIYIRVTTAGQSKLAVLQALCTALRLTGVKLTSRQMEQRLNRAAHRHRTG
jgi:hypothetical protein